MFFKFVIFLIQILLMTAIFPIQFVWATDVTAPVLTSFSIEPTEIDICNGPGSVRFEVTATDDLSGVGYVQVAFNVPGGTGSPNEIIPMTLQNGVWKGTYSLTTQDKGGIYPIYRIIVRDSAGNTPNSKTYYSDEIAGLGYPIKFWVFAIIKGDINGDNSINLIDAITGLQIVCGNTPSYIYVNADIDNDDKIGMENVIYILENLSRQ